MTGRKNSNHSSSPPGFAIDSRVLVAMVALVIIAVAFWSGSRYPSLNEKALMAGNLILEDPLGFEATLELEEDAGVLRKIGVTFVNWVVTNWKGMTFGLLFAAAFMTLMSRLSYRYSESRYRNSFLGLLVGAPLGVCVNCAAPIAKGMHDAGSRLETTLATLISSPSLNVLVVVMLFTLFPPYMALTRVIVIILFILLVIPVIARICARTLRGPGIPAAKPWSMALVGTDDASPLRWFTGNYVRNLWFILRTTVPLMVLAGLLGAAVITLVPWEAMTRDVADMSGATHLLFLCGLGLIGLFLPVPIAFDVFICALLLSAGLPEGHVMILLTTLGSFSVYSFFIVSRYMSWQAATLLSVALIGAAMGSGVLVDRFSDWALEFREQRFLNAFASLNLPAFKPESRHSGQSLESLEIIPGVAELEGWQAVSIGREQGLSVEMHRHSARNPGDKTLFTRIDGLDLGMTLPPEGWLPHRYILPFGEVAGIAAGDVHNDGFPDLLINLAGEMQLFANIGGQRFARQQIRGQDADDGFAGVLALVDIDNDGWLDIFHSGYQRESRILYNDRGEFSAGNSVVVEGYKPNLVHAVGFADIDRDGVLEAALGGFTAGHTYLFLEESRNALVDFSGDSAEVELLPGVPGETLSVLFQDLNEDGWQDLVVGNDYQIPDVLYRNDGAGRLVRDDAGELRIRQTTYSTMSITSGDVDNDLSPELYFGQITGSMIDDHALLDQVESEALCAAQFNPERQAHCRERMDIHDVIQTHRTTKAFEDLFGCKRIADVNQRMDCVAIEMFLWSRREKFHAHCALFPARWAELGNLCNYLDREGFVFADFKHRLYPFQDRRENRLLKKDDGGRFRNVSREMEVGVAGWTWNADFADVDNDGWLDLYAVNGYFGSRRRESNMFFHNLEGRKLVEQTTTWGLTDHLATGAAAYVDFDRDGDLDIITVPFQSAPVLFLNGGDNNSISVELVDHRGNRGAIGSRVVLRQGEGRAQMREIQLSGGFMSFDEPVAYFGLGEDPEALEMEISWPDGVTQVLSGPFPANARYRITRGR